MRSCPYRASADRVFIGIFRVTGSIALGSGSWRGGEIIHKPGEALIVDWGKLREVIDPLTGKKRTLWVLSGVLGYSRYLMARLVWTNATETTLLALRACSARSAGFRLR